ncbi:MAG: Trk-type K+ transporter membrane component [Bernardetiaceae bacterium]|nr:Trk-type K+ transporter membrane component [Bernardetiaceae bacterium]
MEKYTERLRTYIYDSRERVLLIDKRLALLNAIVAIGVLIYRYGFILSDEQADFVFRFLDVQFLLFAVLYFFRVIYSSSVKQFIKDSYVEGLLLTAVLLHGAINYFFGFKAILYVIDFYNFTNPSLVYQHFLSLYMLVLIGFDFARISAKISDINFKPATTFLLSFVMLIFVGMGLLMLPAMTTIEGGISMIDALFTSTSASCVTGLIVLDTGQDFTMKGHIVILVLIQLGGIGMVSFATFFASFLTSGVGLKQQSIIQDYLSSDSLDSASRLLRRVVFLTLFLELLGAIAIFLTWEEDLWEQNQQFASLGDKIFFSIFHSVSAFCNGGFSLFSGGLGDADFKTNRMYSLHFVVIIIIIMGSLGFTTIEEVFSWKNIRERMRRPWRHLSVGTIMVLYGTGSLILLGTIGVMFLEYDQMTDRNIVEAFITSLFQSVTTRTAGFNTMDIASLSPPTIFMFLILMFIGAASGSTGGGIKITTFVLVFVASMANIRRQERIVIRNRTISDDLVRKAYSIFMFAVAYNIVAIFLLLLVETPPAFDPNNPDASSNFILKVVFEQVSAFATVGLSMNYTATLSFWGKCIIITSMYLGRVGTLTLALALSNTVITNSYRYPNAHIMVG